MNKKEALIYVLQTGNFIKCVDNGIIFSYSDFMANAFFSLCTADDGGDEFLPLWKLPDDGYYEKVWE